MCFFLRSCFSGQSSSSFSVNPSYTFWAPWIGRSSRRSAIVFNTEYRKCSGGQNSSQSVPDQPEEGHEQDHKLSEEDLVEMMEFSSVYTSI